MTKERVRISLFPRGWRPWRRWRWSFDTDALKSRWMEATGMGILLLGILMILWGLMLMLHLAVPSLLLGVLALVTGILLIVGK
jgi:uncharacterized membrane protein HdeD (DUF308 family)